ncbi:MAG: aldolase/citrate lyase family protein [Burkholderiaceae bacterium]
MSGPGPGSPATTSRPDDRNALMRRLDAGEVALGLSVRLAGAPGIASIAADCGFDWLFIDLEHGPMAFDTAAATALAALAAGITPVVRVAGHEAFHANRALTNGALGLIFPHVDDAAQALACSRSARFAPQGSRGVPAVFPQLGWRKPPLAEATARLNALTSVIVMIESAAAVQAAEAIAAVPGVDALFVGASDLSVEMGHPGDYRAPAVREALSHVADAAARHGCHAGLGGVGDAGLLGELVREGYRLLLAGNDLDLFMSAARERTRQWHALAGPGGGPGGHA